MSRTELRKKNGCYRIYDPVLFSQGKKELIWEGMWKEGTKNRSGMFVSRLAELAPKIQQFLELFYIFTVSIEAEKRIVQRIEAAIANHLLKQEGVIGAFQDKDIKYLPKTDTEETMTIIFENTPILGLANELIA